ncbi:hypothetical protein ABZP36_032657 [Zizania latifolia]
MEKFLVAAPPPSGDVPAPPPPRFPLPILSIPLALPLSSNFLPVRRWHRWSRIAVELDGRIDARFRHRQSVRLLDSYSEVTELSKRTCAAVVRFGDEVAFSTGIIA